MATRGIGSGTLGIPAGRWRWAAGGFLLLAVAAGALAVAEPQSVQWTGVALIAGIGMVGGLFVYAVWPREALNAADTRRTAEAAARANVAWAITAADGALINCNQTYRRMAGCETGEPPPPELALAGGKPPSGPAAAVLYRLARDAGARQSREESIPVAPGLEIVVAARPLAGGQTSWWFTPKLAAAPKGTRTDSLSANGEPGEIFREAPIGIAVIDNFGTVVDANTAFRAFFGGASALSGRKIGDLVTEETSEPVCALVAKAAERTANGTRVEVRPADGSKQMADLFASPIGEGRILLYLLDTSERKALETKFAQAQKMQAVGQLAGGVAHDFNNHLTVIIGNCEILLMRHQAGDPSFKEINEINQYALRAANLVKQLLAFSRKQTLQPKVLYLRDAISELAIMLRRLLREGIELKLEPAADLWPVHADEAQISNAIINLVVNARDAMPNGGTITIRIENETLARPQQQGTGSLPAGEYVRIEVADTGTGISKENLDKIFDPFFTTKPVGQGTGLGLATVYGIVKQTGGFISVVSEPGAGTSFFIRLPRHRAESEENKETVKIAQPRDMTGQDTILLVEDEEAVRSFAARALRMRGYQVLEAPGGEEALEIVRQAASPIHLLITDVVMPNMDGPTLVRTVKELKPEMAVIFMSGYAEDAFQRNEQTAENLHFLPKPFGLKQLAAKVKEVLSEAAGAKPS